MKGAKIAHSSQADDELMQELGVILAQDDKKFNNM